MRNFHRLWRAGLTALVLTTALASQGCVIDQVDDQAFTWSWEVEYVGGAGAASCENAGARWVELAATHARTGATYSNRWNCTDVSGLGDVIPSGPYRVAVRLLDASDRVLSQTVIPPQQDQVVFVSEDRLTDLGIVVFQIQAFHLQWSIRRAGQLVTCPIASATGVQLTAVLKTETGPSPPLVFDFPCALPDGQMMGLTTAVPTGNYDLTVKLIGQGGVELDALMGPFNATADQLAVLDPVEFVVP